MWFISQELTDGLHNIAIFNTVGQRVKTLINNMMMPGNYKIQWDGTNDSGIGTASGIYIVVLKTGKGVLSRKIILLR